MKKSQISLTGSAATAKPSGKYNETQLRREFIDPFFIALGWDVNNEKGDAESYKDVIHEDAIKVGGTTKAPDYCFRRGAEDTEKKMPRIEIGIVEGHVS